MRSRSEPSITTGGRPDQPGIWQVGRVQPGESRCSEAITQQQLDQTAFIEGDTPEEGALGCCTFGRAEAGEGFEQRVGDALRQQPQQG